MSTRRGFLRWGLASSALLVAGGGALALRRTRLRPVPDGLGSLDPAEYSVLAAAADRIIQVEPGAVTATEVDVAARVDGVLSRAAPGVVADYKRLLALLENPFVCLLSCGVPGPFTALSDTARDRMLASWHSSRVAVLRTGFQALKRLISAAHYSSPATYRGAGYPGPPEIQG